MRLLRGAMSKRIAILFIFNILHMIHTKLLFVFEHCRHGARSPSSGVNNEDIDYMKQKWGVRGELTGVGMRMHYLLGYRNHLRYSGFLSAYYDPRELLIMSTDINRTIESVLAQVQGLYPLQNGPTLTETQMTKAYPPNDLSDDIYKPIIADLKNYALPNRMHLIPIRTFDPSDQIYILYETSRTSKCKAIDHIRNENRKKDIVVQTEKNFNATYGEQLLKFYNEKDPDYIYNANLVILCDHFIVNLYEDRDLSALEALGIDLKQLNASCQHIMDQLFNEIVFGDKERNVALLSIGSSMRQILHFIHKRIEFDQTGKTDLLDYSAPKILIHSGHDSSISGMQIYMQKAFGTKIVNPVFAENMFFELKKKDKGLNGDLSDYYVDYYIRDELIQSIPYEEFNNNITALLWSKNRIEAFCNKEEEKKDTKSILWIIIWVLISISTILAIVIVIVWCIIRKEKREGLLQTTSINN